MFFKQAKPKVLFICTGNSCRSQMAEGFARSMAGDKMEIFSAGSKPFGKIDPNAVAVMSEIGIDISKQYCKNLRQIPQEKYDAIVTMGCKDACPHLPAKRRFDWQITDLLGKDYAVFKTARDQIGKEVTNLLKELKIIP